MRAMVTGGSGFIGGFVVEELAKEGHDVVIFDVAKPDETLPSNVEYVDGDTRYPSQLKAAMVGCEEVYDIAGVLGTSELMFSNERACDVNIRGAVNVIEVARELGVKRIFHPTKPNDWLNTYSITKFAAEQFCFMFQKSFGMEISVLRWFNAFGPKQHLYPVRKAVPLFIVQAIYDLPIEVFGDGEQTVDMIYVEDIAKIVLRATRECGRLGKVIDTGCGIPITVNDLAKTIIDMVGSKSEIVHLPMRIGEPERSDIRSDTAMLKDVLGIDVQKMTSFDEGMRKTVDWYRDLPREEHQKALNHFSKQPKRSTPV